MKLVNEMGNKYGDWVVISRALNTEHNHASWLCLCVCGNKKVVVGINLRRGISKSCGCSYTLPKGVAAGNHVVSNMIRQAIARGYEFAISKRYLKSLHKRNCFYCGVPPATKTKDSAANYNGNYTYNGVDRIDNKNGYVYGNVATCCSVCNFMKGTMDSTEFIKQANKIANNR
jgi:hypothetical protein